MRDRAEVKGGASKAEALFPSNLIPHCAPPRLCLSTDSKKVNLKPDPYGGKGFAYGVLPLGHPVLLADRPVNAVAFTSASAGEPLVLAAYGPVGAQLGGAELLKVRRAEGGGLVRWWAAERLRCWVQVS